MSIENEYKAKIRYIANLMRKMLLKDMNLDKLLVKHEIDILCDILEGLIDKNELSKLTYEDIMFVFLIVQIAELRTSINNLASLTSTIFEHNLPKC